MAVRILSKHLPAKPAGQLAYIVSLVLLPFWQHLASSPNWNLSLGTKNDPWMFVEIVKIWCLLLCHQCLFSTSPVSRCLQ